MGLIGWGFLLLLGQEIADHLSSCELLGEWLARAALVWIFLIQAQEGACLRKPLLNDRDRKRLVDPEATGTGTAMEATTVGLPEVMGCRPGFVALLHQLFFALFRLPALVAFWWM